MTTANVHVGENRRALDPQRGFQSHREFFHAVMQAGLGRPLDERLQPLRATQGSDESGVDDFAIPEAWAPRVLTASTDDPTLGRTLPIDMERPIVHVQARVDKDHTTSVSGGIRLIRHLNTSDAQTSRVQLESITLTANELMGVSFSSERLMTDNPRALIDLLERSYRDENAGVRLDEFFRGSGAGEPLGVLNSGALISVGKEAGQAAATVLADNFVKLRARCWGYHRAIWHVHQELFPQVAKATIAVGAGGSAIPIWHPGSDEDGTPDLILGRPAYFSDAPNAVGQKGDVLLVNWAEYLDAVYMPLQSVDSMHVRFAALERAFRFYTRNDGQPWWRAPLAPKRSVSTVSPFVTLDARA
jgi:HK97 family phage major capsid protein